MELSAETKNRNHWTGRMANNSTLCRLAKTQAEAVRSRMRYSKSRSSFQNKCLSKNKAEEEGKPSSKSGPRDKRSPGKNTDHEKDVQICKPWHWADIHGLPLSPFKQRKTPFSHCGNRPKRSFPPQLSQRQAQPPAAVSRWAPSSQVMKEISRISMPRTKRWTLAQSP